ncbi:MAG: glutamate/tyrosine decarboxylase-like PLP-dependent enzyme [Polaribacter sp.]|jgi:glutamate/tyrosine decarboxylase-like PLP-dependent enzyme
MKLNKKEWDYFQVYLKEFSRLSSQFIARLDSEKVAKVDVSLPKLQLPENGNDFSDCVKLLETQIIPQLSAARGSRYWAFVTGGATPIATMADWLVSIFDQNVHKAGDSVASLVEHQAINWLLELFDLPKSFNGLMTTGGTACNFLGMCIARQYAGKLQGIDVAKDGVFGLDVEIFSTSPHASTVKALGMAGIGQKSITKILAIKQTEKMDVEDLKAKISASHAKAKIVIASAGTVTTTDFDDLDNVAEVCEQYNAWLHVDGAFGLFERVANGSNGKTKGIERADSITVDCHKWLNVPYDCGTFLTRHLNLLEECFDVPARYLANDSNTPDFMSLGVENSRRFRALPVWMTLLAYGKQGIKYWIENNIQLSKKLADWIEQSENYELSYPCKMNVILFRINATGMTDKEADIKTVTLMKKINLDGRIFISPGHWQGKEVIRLCLSNWQTDESDIEIAKELLIELANSTS